MRVGYTLGALVALTLSVAPSIAQDRTIDGGVVPPEQLEAVQMKCDELFAAPPASDAPSAEAPAAGATDDAAATESTAEAPVEPAATEAPAGGNMAADTPSPATAATIDVETLTAELCEGGGFKVDED